MQEDQPHLGLIREMIEVLEAKIFSLNEALADLRRLQSIGERPRIGTGKPVRAGTHWARLVSCLLAGSFTLAAMAQEVELPARTVKSKLSQLQRRNGIGYTITAGRFQIVLPAGLTRDSVIGEPRAATVSQQKRLQGAFFYVTGKASTRRPGSVPWKLCQMIKDQPGIPMDHLTLQAKQLGVAHPIHFLEVDVRRGEVLLRDH